MKINFFYLTVVFFSIVAHGQSYKFVDGNWLMNGKFQKRPMFSVDGIFSRSAPKDVDSVISLSNSYCIPPFGDAHTHNLDGTYNLKEMSEKYLGDGVFYVQVLGNYGEGAKAARKELQLSKNLDATFANGLLTCTYGHGFFPYEPLAMGIYAPYLQIKYADSIKGSRLAENRAYYFLDSRSDVDLKWPLIMKFNPDQIKICLNDAENYAAKRKLEKADDNGLSPDVAAYVVQKAHSANLRVFAHVETANDARLCAQIGVDALAHMPGYYWDGRDETKVKYCMTKADIKLFRKSGLAVIPTMNIDGTTKFDSTGKASYNYVNHLAAIKYKRRMLRALYNGKVNIALGADYFGKTVAPEIDSLIKHKIFTNKQLVTIYSQTTPQLIFPGRKIGEIKEGYEASFLVLSENPLLDIEAIKKITLRFKQGRIISLQ